MIKRDQGQPVWDEDRAIWKQVAAELQERITSGRYRQRSAIPSITQLEEEFWVSRDTIRRALRHLTGLNMIRAETGVGTFVTTQDQWRAEADLADGG
ncbi:winged helix-turn-helix domain-containing protein [Streptosporangium saharense]|uniref:GntR family transcriptional regulator n=1 Tax=Streptosporangium saharense TaxID=1706840 RepID=A0A7W7QMX3_9ACTN|nr:winged helix-turn-helix domain-containing protein [Streptosporangium saharense]MBB4916554.1 GntR family transcriptional regulator [Streptosporangium saharense]